MADRIKAYANQNIVGLGPPPWDLSATLDWPTGGYDEALHRMDVDWDDKANAIAPAAFRASGYTKAEWLALADEMIARWTAWRALIAAKPEEPGNG